MEFHTSHSPTGKGSCVYQKIQVTPRYTTRKRCITSIYTFWNLTVFWRLLLENAACFISVYIFQIQRTRTLWFCLGEVRLAYQPLFSELSPRSPFPSPLPPLLPPGVGYVARPERVVESGPEEKWSHRKLQEYCSMWLLPWLSQISLMLGVRQQFNSKKAFIYLRFRCDYKQ